MSADTAARNQRIPKKTNTRTNEQTNQILAEKCINHFQIIKREKKILFWTQTNLTQTHNGHGHGHGHDYICTTR